MQPPDKKGDSSKPGNEKTLPTAASLTGEEARKALGGRLKRARELLGLSQAQFSASTGASKRGVQDNEAGKSIPGGQVLAALAALGINVNWLLTGKGQELMHDVAEPSQLVRLDGAMMGRALVSVRRLLAKNGLESTTEGEGELAAILYEMYQEGYAWQAAERSVAALMRTTTSAIREQRHEQHEHHD